MRMDSVVSHLYSQVVFFCFCYYYCFYLDTRFFLAICPCLIFSSLTSTHVDVLSHTNRTQSHTYTLTPDDSPLPLLGWPFSPSFIHPSLLPSPGLKGQVTRAQEAEENYLVKRELATVKQQSEDTSAQLEQAHNTIRQLQQIHQQQGVSTSAVSQRHLEGWRNHGALTWKP